MSHKDGYFDGTELAVRCWICGDSTKNPSKAHCSVNVYKNIYHCYRCQSGGYLSSEDMGYLTQGLKLDFSRIQDPVFKKHKTDDFIEAITAKVRHGPGIDRYSAMERHHIPMSDGLGKLDVFEITDASKNFYGYHIRHPTNKGASRTYGKRLLGLSKDIRHNKPWRIVEGAYDVLDPQMDVCVFGFPSEMQARELRGKEVILCPDGDVFEDYRKLRTFMKHLLWDNSIFIKYIEKLPPGMDPDQVKFSSREKVSVTTVREMLTPKRSFFINRLTPEQILSDLQSQMPEEEFWGQYDVKP